MKGDYFSPVENRISRCDSSEALALILVTSA
jgi:hypothetical protein